MTKQDAQPMSNPATRALTRLNAGWAVRQRLILIVLLGMNTAALVALAFAVHSWSIMVLAFPFGWAALAGALTLGQDLRAGRRGDQP